MGAVRKTFIVSACLGIFLICILLTGKPLSVHFLSACCCLSRVVLLADTSRVGPQHPDDMPLSRKLFVTDQLTGFIWSVGCFPQTIWDCLFKGGSVWVMIRFKFYRTAIIQERHSALEHAQAQNHEYNMEAGLGFL